MNVTSDAMHREISAPLGETIRAIHALGLYTTVVRSRAEFLPKTPAESSPVPTDALPAFFWLTHPEIRRPGDGLYTELLQTLMTRGGIASRRFAAASFLLRYGWSSGVVIAPLLMEKPIPLYAAEKAELCFSANTLLQAICLHGDGFAVARGHAFSRHGHCLLTFDDRNEAIRRVGRQLLRHAEPVVEALHEWSGFSRKALWAMVSSSWVGQILNVGKRLALSEAQWRFYLTEFYAQWRPIAGSLPHWYSIEEQGRHHYFHTRASCCLYFKGEKRHFCASCPVLKEEERVERNRRWVRKYES